jgi:hypothetical protein
MLAVALVLTQIEFPFRYWRLVALEELPSWILLIRDVVLVALAGVLVLPLRRPRGEAARSP